MVPGDIQNLRWLDRWTLAWNAEPSAVEFHVYRDEVSTLTYIDSPACRDDLDAVRTDLQATDIGSPPASTAWYYLVTAESCSANEGTLGMGTCAERSNFTPCPWTAGRLRPAQGQGDAPARGWPAESV